MKIKDLITEEGGLGSIASSAMATSITAGEPGSIFAGVPLKRNMPRKRAKKEATELLAKKDKSNVIEEKE